MTVQIHATPVACSIMAPVAIKWPALGVGLNSMARTGPSWPGILHRNPLSSASKGRVAPLPAADKTASGFHTLTTPSDMPPASRPSAGFKPQVAAAPHVNDENRPLHMDTTTKHSTRNETGDAIRCSQGAHDVLMVAATRSTGFPSSKRVIYGETCSRNQGIVPANQRVPRFNGENGGSQHEKPTAQTDDPPLPNARRTHPVMAGPATKSHSNQSDL
jgi:hypothetical protein